MPLLELVCFLRVLASLVPLTAALLKFLLMEEAVSEYAWE
jgi:hypothetical protein